jgi:hypothetical protein
MKGDAMSQTPDTTATAGDGANFDPRQAAALLDQTTQQARRQLEPSPPWLLTIRAIGVLATCGAVWLSVRGQHPYKGPTAAVIPVLVAFLIVNFVASVTVRMRATAGVTGRTRLRPGEIAVLATALVGTFVVLAVLAAAGVSPVIVYGVDSGAVVLIALGLAWAGINAVKAQWHQFGVGLAVALVGAVGAFAGPVGVWLVMGIGLCAVLLGAAAAVIWRQHRRPVQP